MLIIFDGFLYSCLKQLSDQIMINNQLKCMTIKSPYDGNCVTFFYSKWVLTNPCQMLHSSYVKCSEGWSMSKLILNGENLHNPIQFTIWTDHRQPPLELSFTSRGCNVPAKVHSCLFDIRNSYVYPQNTLYIYCSVQFSPSQKNKT